MTKTVLDFLLASAGGERPITRFELRSFPGISFEWLQENGYLHGTGQLASSVILDRFYSCEVVRNPFARIGAGYSYWDEDQLVPIEDAEQLEEFAIDYGPLAKVLAVRLGCHPEPDVVIPNYLWKLGAPEMTCEEVYLARNAGTNEKVREAMVPFREENTVYCLGTFPTEPATKASLCRLRDFLRWDESSGISHVERLPASIERASDAYSNAPTSGNLFQRGGDFWHLRYNYGIVQHVKDLNGCFYLAKLLANPHRSLSPDEVDPPAYVEVASIDKEELNYGFEIGNGQGNYMEAIDKEANEDIALRLKEQKSILEEARNAGDKEKATEAQKQIKWLDEYRRKNTKQDGTPRNANKDNIRHVQAIARAIKTAIDDIESVDKKIAVHLRSSLTYGNRFMYAPKDVIEWNISLG